MVISEMEGSQRKTDVQDRRLSLIDFSSADDSLINSISGNPLDHLHSVHAELMDTPNSKKFEDASNKLEEWEQVPQPTETFEQEKVKKNSKCNLRKSLAWDTAFFTSAGVLDPEELSSIIEGTEKDEKHALPGIQEDVYQSCESISTLESDSLTLESLEADLFEDIRASIQKSSKKSNAANANSKIPSEVTGFQTGDSVKTVGMASQNKMKAPPTSKSASASTQGSGKMTKKNPVCPQVSQKLVASRRESSISKQPKVPGKSSSSPTMLAKRASPSNLPVKSEKDKAKGVIGRVSLVSKAPILGNSQRAVPKSSLLSNSSSVSSAATKTKPTLSKPSGSNSSGNIDNSPFNSSKRKVAAGTIKPPSSSSAVRTPSRIALKRKTDSRNSNLSRLISVTKLSSSISPASSISDWSSESSSSTSVAKHNSSRTSLGSTSSRKVLSDNDTTQASNSQYPPGDSSLEGQETQLSGFVSQCPGTTSVGAVLPPAPMKPSGLRLPSPKIGFFDGVKSLVRTPRGGTQSNSTVAGGLSKHGSGSVNPSESQNKGKLQPARSIKSISKIKHNYQQNSDAIPHNELSDVAIKMSNDCQNTNSSSEIPLEVQNKALLRSSAGDLKANNTMTEGHLIGIHAPMLGSTQNDGTPDISINKLNSEIEDSRCSIDVRAAPTDEDNNNSDSSSAYHFANTSSSETLGGSLICGEFNLPKVEGPGLVTHDICMYTSGIYSAEKKEVPEIPLDKMNLEGNSGKSNRATLTDGGHDTGVSSATNNNFAITSFSNVVVKAPVFCQLDLVNDVDSSKVANNQKNAHDDQVECLSRQVAFVDIGVENVKETTSDSPSLSRSDTSSQDKFNGWELSSHKKLLGCSKMEEPLNASLSSTNFATPASTRRPFAVKDSFWNMDGLLSVTTESTVSEVKAANLPLPVSIMKENN